jgi:hypothetical protein
MMAKFHISSGAKFSQSGSSAAQSANANCAAALSFFPLPHPGGFP